MVFPKFKKIKCEVIRYDVHIIIGRNSCGSSEQEEEICDWKRSRRRFEGVLWGVGEKWGEWKRRGRKGWGERGREKEE